MTKPDLLRTGTIRPVTFHKYERYLPTAFDESLSILEKMNKIIYAMNNLGDLTDDMLEKWNTVYEWVMNEGLEDSVNAKLTEWLENGTLDEIINQTLFSGLDQRLQWLESLTVNPEKFGLSESNPDNAEAIQSALNILQASGGGVLQFPQGKTFKTSQWGSYRLSNLTIDLNGSTIEFVGGATSGTPLIQFAGTYGVGALLSADAEGGSKTVKVDTTGFAKGDMVRIYSNSIWDSTRTNTRIGEIAFVENVISSTELTLTTELHNYYRTSDTAKIEKVNPIRNITIKNGTIQGLLVNDETTGIEIKLGLDCRIENLISKDIDKRHVALIDCLRTNVTGCTFEESYHTNQAYGVSLVDASADCIISHNYFRNVRHSMTTNNQTSTSYGITRRILFSHNSVTDSVPNIGDGNGGDAIDAHAGSEDIHILDNIVYSSSGHGINMEGRTGRIHGNRIRNTAGCGMYVNPRSDYASSFVITDNYISNGIGDGENTDAGINISMLTADGTGYVISNNRVDSLMQGIRFVGTNANKCTQSTITGNYLNVTGSGYGIHLEFVEYVSITGNTVHAPMVGIIASETESAVIGSNSIILYGAGENAYGIRLQGNTSYCSITGNSCRDAGSERETSYGVIFSSEVINSIVSGNACRGFATASIHLNTGTGNLETTNI